MDAGTEGREAAPPPLYRRPRAAVGRRQLEAAAATPGAAALAGQAAAGRHGDPDRAGPAAACAGLPRPAAGGVGVGGGWWCPPLI